MKRFLYIEARDVSVPEDGGPMVSFATAFVTVETTFVAEQDERRAYRLGAQLLHNRLRESGGDPFNHSTGRFLNDYVVEVPVA